MYETARDRRVHPDVRAADAEASSSAVATGVQLLAAGRYVMHEPQGGKPKSQPTWLVELILSGELLVRVRNGPWQSYRRGHGMLYAPNTPYWERVPHSGAVCESVGLLFDMGTSQAFQHCNALQPTFHRLEDPHERLTRLAEQVLSHLGTGMAGDLLAQGCLLQMLGGILQAQMTGENWTVTADHAEHDLVSRTHRFMQTHLARPLLLSDLARETGHSDSGFAHAYKRLTGESPMAALRRRRVDAVKFHLYSNRHTLAEIAQLTGFTDAFHLSRTFKQLLGISPRDFRKQIR
jgi:AraC-like DNA-binding protein